MTTSHRRRTRLRVGAAAALLALGLLAGCGSGEDSAGSAVADQAPEAPAGGGQDAGGQDGGGDASGGTSEDGGQGGGEVEVAERKVTRSQVTVEVEDLAASAARVRELAEEAGGEVADESLNLDEDGSYDQGYYGQEQYGGSDGPGTVAAPRVQAGPGEAVLVLRVPPDAAGSTVDAVAGLGEEKGRWTSSTSVETTLVDLETRIESQTRAVEQAQALLGRAQDLDDVVMLENEVNRRTADLESLQARRTSVQEQVDRATVTVVLRLPGGAPPEDRAGFLGGLEAGWDALVTSGGVLLVVVGALLPWAVLVALVGVPLWWWLRRRRARRPAGRVGPPGFGPPPGPPSGPPAGPPPATA